MSKFSTHENTDFKELSASDHFLTIEEGEFKDVSFSFGKIEFLGEDDDGQGHVKFDYDLLQVPDSIILQESAETRERLENVIGEILHEILVDMTVNNGEADEIGNADTEQFVA